MASFGAMWNWAVYAGLFTDHFWRHGLPARSRDEDRRRSKEVGFDHHLLKPVDAAELNRLLAEGKR